MRYLIDFEDSGTTCLHLEGKDGEGRERVLSYCPPPPFSLPQVYSLSVVHSSPYRCSGLGLFPRKRSYEEEWWLRRRKLDYRALDLLSYLLAFMSSSNTPGVYYGISRANSIARRRFRD